MAYADANTKLIRQVSIINESQAEVALIQVQPGNTVYAVLTGDVSLAALTGNAGVEAGTSSAGVGQNAALTAGAGTGANAGGDVEITAGAAPGAGAGGDIVLEPGTSLSGLRGEIGLAGPVAYSIDSVGSAGAISGSANPVVRLTAGGNYTLATPAVGLVGRQISIYNDQAVAAVFTTITGVTSISLAQNEALTVLCTGTSWITLGTTGTVTP